MEIYFPNLVKSDVYIDLEFARTKGKQLDDEYEFVKHLEKETGVEQSYKDLLLCLLTKEVRFVPSKRKNEKDDTNEHDEDWNHEENDPQYELFLRNLEKHEKSYVFNYKKNGSCIFIRYEEDSDSDDYSDQEPQRKLTCREPQRKLTNTVKGEKVEATRRLSDSKMPDSDYLLFMQNTRAEGGYFAFSYGGGTIAYDKDIVISPEKGDYDDGSDLKILEIAPACEDETENFMLIEEVSSKTNSDFRKELMCILRKPYDREEYKQLRQDVQVRKAALRHRELRNGRENGYSTDKAGKSYLDRYADLKEALLRCRYDKPRCLNLLRGFFFWLQCLTREGAFKPWKDPQCLAVEPIHCRHPDPERKIKQAIK